MAPPQRANAEDGWREPELLRKEEELFPMSQDVKCLDRTHGKTFSPLAREKLLVVPLGEGAAIYA